MPFGVQSFTDMNDSGHQIMRIIEHRVYLSIKHIKNYPVGFVKEKSVGLKGRMGGGVPQVSKQYTRWTRGPGRTGRQEGREENTGELEVRDTSKHPERLPEGVKPSTHCFSIFPSFHQAPPLENHDPDIALDLLVG